MRALSRVTTADCGLIFLLVWVFVVLVARGWAVLRIVMVLERGESISLPPEADEGTFTVNHNIRK